MQRSTRTRKQAARARILRTASVYVLLLLASVVCARLNVLGLLPLLIGSTVTVGLVSLAGCWVSWEADYLDPRPDYGHDE